MTLATARSRALRKSMNSTELLVWSRLRHRQVDGWKFRRQHPIGPYVTDFYCPAARLVVEIQGPAHDDEGVSLRDDRRQAWMEANGYSVMRVPVAEIGRSLDEVIGAIYQRLLDAEEMGSTRRPHRPASPGTSPQAGKS